MIGYPEKDQIFIRKLTEIVLDNLEDEGFGIKELADKVGISHYRLRRRLHSITGKTISQFIRETRLLKALEILQNEDISAAEVAYKVGFGSPAYFNTCFNEFFGYPPGKVNKRDLDNQEEMNPVMESAKEQGIRSPWRIVIIGLSVILICAVLLYQVFDGIPKNHEKSIAVLPFNNLSNSVADQYFIDGVMEEILTDLSSIHDLRVVSRTSVQQFHGRQISTPEIARMLKVAYLVEGSGQKYGNRFRLRVQLIEASTDRHIWAKSYEKEIIDIRDIFSIQTQVAQSIAEELKATITPEEKMLIEKIPSTNITAYDLYNKGRAKLDKFPYPDYNPVEVKNAEALFHEALKNDSTLARAYTGLAEVIWKRWDNDNTLAERSNLSNYLDSMLLLANIALSYDDQLAEAYIIRGQYYAVNGSLNQALEEWDKALEYNPNYGPAYRLKGGIYEELDILKAIQNFEKAVFFNQGTSLLYILNSIGYDYFQAGFPEEGVKYLTEVLLLDGDSVKYYDNLIKYRADTQGDYKKAIDHFTSRYLSDSTNTEMLVRLGYLNSLTGNFQESLNYYNKYLSILKNRGVTTPPFTCFTHIGYAYLQNGYRKEAEYYFDKQIEAYKNRLTSVRSGERIYWLYPLACVYSCKGDKDKAYEYLNAFSQNPGFMLSWVILLKNDPQFKSMRGEPEFQKIVRDVEAKYQADHKRVGKWLEELGKL